MAKVTGTGTPRTTGPQAGSRCPLCRIAAAPRPGNPAYPFCSERCRLIDLGRWLGEEYRIPGEQAGEGDGGPDGPAGPANDTE